MIVVLETVSDFEKKVEWRADNVWRGSLSHHILLLQAIYILQIHPKTPPPDITRLEIILVRLRRVAGRVLC